MATILVADDEQSIRDSIRMILEYERYRVVFAENGAKAIDLFRQEAFDAVLLDIKMPPGKDGIEVLKELRAQNASVPVVMISGHGTFETAVEATKLGAFDYLPKPLDRDKLLITLRNALEHRRLSGVVEQMRGKDAILGTSARIREILGVIERVAPTEARVLITGESGTGKELVARAIHRASKRARGPLVEVNCAAIPHDLIESELFGHEKGSFTGATAQRLGKFEQADGGTIFLDEVGDMSMSAQAKVLRALEAGRVERVGGTTPIPVDVRVIAATNKDLAAEIAKGNFREDLFHRLNVIPIVVPPLRERPEDIPVLVEAFVREACERNGFALKKISPAAMAGLAAMEWSGNVRELKNYVERLAILSPGNTIERADVGTGASVRRGELDELIGTSATLQEFKDHAEAAFIRVQLEKHKWNVSKTAEALGMERSHLYTKIKKYGLQRAEGAPPDEE